MFFEYVIQVKCVCHVSNNLHSNHICHHQNKRGN
ncbi:hypothetical protein Taro_054234, partial [Colocasia esculenta]|nr:hypothetical protein [Colocasia esculenta]